MKNSKTDQVRDFLKRLKQTVVTKGIYFIPREINLNALAELGFTQKNAIDIILTLSVDDYCEGPLKDRDKPGNVWIFGKHVMENNIYMKLKLATIKNRSGKKMEIAKCISFHIASHPLAFPLRNKKGGPS